eukprot:TRINITY_DN13988_c0_g4_i1.p1 TRINITY_DN13988_c0_g4~~TRINITY_DN13988_c0_g4_i1.p1  ORF type:complete len:1202 (+),score=248.98 TRINITY_DN13988_c0_g4_i1:92-3697(+)
MDASADRGDPQGDEALLEIDEGELLEIDDGASFGGDEGPGAEAAAGCEEDELGALAAARNEVQDAPGRWSREERHTLPLTPRPLQPIVKRRRLGGARRRGLRPAGPRDGDTYLQQWRVLHSVSERAALSERCVAEVQVSGHRALLALPAATARTLQAHQVGAVRFMWRAVFLGGGPLASAAQGGSGVEPTGGCVLAHEMGMGKTLSTITVLVLYHLLRLQRSRSEGRPAEHPPGGDTALGHSLVVAPASVLQTWASEWQHWVGSMGLGEALRPRGAAATGCAGLYVPQWHSVRDKQCQEVAMWERHGGCLLLSHNRLYVALKSHRARAVAAGEAAGGRNPWESVRSLPRLMVFDEAHGRVSSRTSSFRQLASQLPVAGRIALTGTPLQNSLDELWSLVDIVRPGFYQRRYFRDELQAPVERGRDADAAEHEVQQSKERTFLLNAQLAPVVNRKGIADMQRGLPPMHDVIVTVALTPVQLRMYRTIVQWARMPRVRTWMVTYHLLSRCVVDPLGLLRKLRHHVRKLDRAAAAEDPTGASDPTRADAGGAAASAAAEPAAAAPQLSGEAATIAAAAAAAEDPLDVDDIPPAEFLSESDCASSCGEAAAADAGSDSDAGEVASIEPVNIKGLLSALEAAVDDGASDPQDEMATEALQAMNGLPSAKIAACVAIVRHCRQLQPPRKVLIFSQWLHAIAACSAALTEDDPGVRVDKITGQMGRSTREGVLANFRDGNLDALIMSMGTCSSGINLQEASVVILLDYTWNPQTMRQALGRAWRWGQANTVHVVRLLGRGGFEEQVARKALAKQWLFRRVVDGHGDVSQCWTGKDLRATFENIFSTRNLNAPVGPAEEDRLRELADRHPLLRALFPAPPRFSATAMESKTFFRRDTQRMSDEHKRRLLQLAPPRQGIPWGLPCRPDAPVDSDSAEGAPASPAAPATPACTAAAPAWATAWQQHGGRDTPPAGAAQGTAGTGRAPAADAEGAKPADAPRPGPAAAPEQSAKGNPAAAAPPAAASADAAPPPGRRRKPRAQRRKVELPSPRAPGGDPAAPGSGPASFPVGPPPPASPLDPAVAPGAADDEESDYDPAEAAQWMQPGPPADPAQTPPPPPGPPPADSLPGPPPGPPPPLEVHPPAPPPAPAAAAAAAAGLGPCGVQCAVAASAADLAQQGQVLELAECRLGIAAAEAEALARLRRSVGSVTT